MADMTIAYTLAGTVGGRLFRYTTTGTVADVDAVMYAQSSNRAGLELFSPQSYGGLAAVMIVGGNAVGIARIELTQASTDILDVFVPAGFPFTAYNGGNFNGMMRYGTTATDGPDQDPDGYNVAQLGGIASFRAIGALKAIS